MTKKKIPAFKNEEYKNYSEPREYRAMESALRATGGRLGESYPLVIGGEHIRTNETIASRNPAHPDEVIGNFAKGTTEHAAQALQAASKAFATWSKVPY